MSAAIKLGAPEAGFFHFGPRWTDMDSLCEQNLCLTPDQKMVLPIKVANDQKINLAS